MEEGGSVSNCLEIIYSILLTGFPPLCWAMPSFQSRKATQSPRPSPVLPLSFWEETPWAELGCLPRSASNCLWNPEFATFLSQTPKEAKRGPAPFQVNERRQVALKKEGHLVMTKFCLSQREVNMDVPPHLCCAYTPRALRALSVKSGSSHRLLCRYFMETKWGRVCRWQRDGKGQSQVCPKLQMFLLQLRCHMVMQALPCHLGQRPLGLNHPHSGCSEKSDLDLF